MKKDVISPEQFSREELEEMLALSARLKQGALPECRPLADAAAALIFEKHSPCRIVWTNKRANLQSGK